ncbi:Zn(2)-C6 fungal-type domain-containing protein [Fusarium keratoplasticum]|uniref:Zn(2)-C6 fungal-type domain-containing protein n=1 Tax=Fusarium keratoplasticum TaxID=1328300 RepID=A0ACC0QPP1_9HYPO|nr:Zn(2)-C6 fungal-type domain-containing protein [Fusarium keratoplasticum]KAI8660414.1 Zn(2)-C6 fungal-type domain-containing protein [Fusarium keratoplasticum]
MRQPMRSSIACLRCRRSKIKCDNDGGNSPCDTCIKGGHQCQYPEATSLAPKRIDPPASGRQEKDGPHERKRARKMDEAPGLDSEKSTAYAEEILTYPFLTIELWDQLFAIYKQHFATELSFIHLPTLKEKMRRRQGQKQHHSSELNLVLLGILTLTARFHTDLVKYVTHLSSQQGGNVRPRTIQHKPDPIAASEFFANALTTALGPLRTAMTVVTVERVQAFLMLGLFEWSQRHAFSNSSAWMYVGVAIRMAKLLKLGLDDHIMKIREARVTVAHESRTRSSEIGIIRESRRRTMYSCLVLDRMMACGSERTMSIPLESIGIQLPCSEMAFDLALDVYTGYLRCPEESISQKVNDDSTLSRFVQLVAIWSDISQYSTAGGRSQETASPWDSRSTFRQLRERLDRFHMDLPDTFTLSRQNYYRHDNHQATNTYVSLHMLSSVCQIILNREYLPFLPIRCDRPQGPLASAQDPARDRFWEEAADNVFRASRDILDLVEICKDKLPQSCLTVFAVWLSGFMAVYAHQFPIMDIQQRMVISESIERDMDEGTSVLEGATTRTSCQALRKLTKYLPVAQNYLTYLEELNQYFVDAKSQFNQQANNADPMSKPSFGVRRLSIRPVGDTGLDESYTKADKASPQPPSDDGHRSQHDEGSDRSRGSSWEPLRSMGVPEDHQGASNYTHGPSISPALSFSAMGSSAGLRSGLAESPPVVLEHRGEGLSAKAGPMGDAGKPPSSLSESQLLLPGLDEGIFQQSIPEFSMEKLEMIESQRIGKVLNDLEEFAGAGSLGFGIP